MYLKYTPRTLTPDRSELTNTPLRHQQKNIDPTKRSEKLEIELSNLKMFMNKLYYDLKNVDYTLMVKFQHTLNLKDYSKSSLQKMTVPKQNSYKLADLIQIHKKSNNGNSNINSNNNYNANNSMSYEKKSPNTLREENNSHANQDVSNSNRSNKNLDLNSFQNIKAKERELENLMIKSREFQSNISNIEAKLNGMLEGGEELKNLENGPMGDLIKKMKSLEEQISELQNENFALKSLECFDLNKKNNGPKSEISNLINKQQEEILKIKSNNIRLEQENDLLRQDNGKIKSKLREYEQNQMNKKPENSKNDSETFQTPNKKGILQNPSKSQNQNSQRKSDKKVKYDEPIDEHSPVIKDYLSSLNEQAVENFKKNIKDNKEQQNLPFERIIMEYLQKLNEKVFSDYKGKLDELAAEEVVAREKELFVIKEYIKTLNEKAIRDFLKNFQKTKKSIKEPNEPKFNNNNNNMGTIKKNSLKSGNNENEDLKSILLGKEDELNILKKAYNDLRNDHEQLLEQNEILKNKTLFYDQQINNLENERKNTLKDLMELKKENDGKRNKKEEEEFLKEQMKIMEMEKKELHEENENLVSNGKALAEELNNCRKQIESIKASEELRAEFIELKTKIFDLEQINENIIKNVEKYVKGYESLLKKFQELHKNYRKLVLDKSKV